MSTVEESVVMAMDGVDSNLFPYLPYILQDIWEIGTSPEIVIELIKKHTAEHSNLRVLDLGCGKGAVSIKLAEEFKCHCLGVDAVEAFIDEAKNRAKEINVDKYCCFECDDIRVKISGLKDYDVVILGAIGPVFGDYYSTLSTVSNCMKENGLVIIDDGYIDDGSEYSHSLAEQKSEILKQTSAAKMKLVDEVITDKDEIAKSGEHIYRHIKKRCQELIDKHPEEKGLFVDYIKKQEEECDALETKLICSTMLFKKCS